MPNARCKVLLSAILLATLGLSGPAEARPYPKDRPFNIAFLTDGPGPHAEGFIKQVKQEILALTGGEFQVAFPKDKLIFGDRSGKNVEAAGDKLLADPAVNLLVTVGPLASHLIALKEHLPRPVIASHIVDPEAQGVPFVAGKSGRKNLAYITSTLSVVRAIEGFRRLLPFQHLTILLPLGYTNHFPAIGRKVQKMAGAIGVKISWVEVSGPVEAAAISKQSDALMLLLPPGAQPVSISKLVQKLNARRLPSFSPFGSEPVDQGILAGFSMKENRLRMTRRLALDVQRLLMGEAPSTFGVTISYGAPELHINLRTANAIGYQPGWDVLSDAVLVGRKRRAARSLTMTQAIREGLQANLSLVVASKRLQSGIYDVRQALARWAPAVNLSASAVFINAGRANPLFGSYERAIAGGAQIDQLLFSEKALANVSIQKHLQRSREQETEQVKLDIMAAVATAYVNLLRALANERLQKANLKVTKKNLELALVRRAVGTAGMADVHRWETRLANDKRSVIRGIAQRNQAEIALNGLRRRPLEEPFKVADADADGGERTAHPGQRIKRHIRNPWAFAALREFMVREGLAQAPELAALDRAIEAQQRSLTSSKLDFFVPSLAFRFNLDRRFHGSPEGDAAPAIPGLSLSAPDATSWSAAFALSWPIFEGSAKYHRYKKASVELSRLRTQRAELALQLEQRIRSALHQTGSSFPGIKLSGEAAAAAHKSLELVSQAYARGATSVIDLIDAQNAALAADLAAAVAFYEFSADLIAAMRAIGHQGFFLRSENDQKSWLDRLDRFVASSQKRGN